MPVNLPFRKFTDLLMVGGLALYFATFTLPFNKGLANLGMHIAFLGFVGAYFNHPNKDLVLRFVVKPWILLFSFFVLIFLGPRIGSPDLLLSGKNFFTDFDDVFFVAPALLFLIQSIEKQRNILILFLLAGLSLAVTIGATISLKWSALPAHALREYGDAIVVLWPFILFTLVSPPTGSLIYRLILRILAVAVMIVFSLALMTGGSRGAWIAVLFSTVGLGSALLRSGSAGTIKKIVLFFFGAVFCLVAVLQSSLRSGDSGRTELVWKPAIGLTQQSPLRGYGYDRKAYFSSQEQLQASPQGKQMEFRAAPDPGWGPHNLTLQVAFFSGWPSAALFMVFVLSAACWWCSRRADPDGRGLVFVGAMASLSYFGVRGLVEELNFTYLAVLAPLWILIWSSSDNRLGDKIALESGHAMAIQSTKNWTS